MTQPTKQSSDRSQARQHETARPDLAGQEGAVFLEEPDLGALQRAVAHPDSATPAAISALARRYGNRAVQRLLAQRQPEEEELQTKPSTGQRGGAEGFELDDATAGRIHHARGGGQPLDGNLQAQLGQAMDHDFGAVRVHTDPEADELNQQLSAKAFTTGQDVFFRQGAYDPGSGSGRDLIAHELSHVVQQSSGRVSGDGSGVTVRPAGDTLEQEADRAARAAAAPATSSVQRQAEEEELVQGSSAAQRQTPEEEEEPVQAKSSVQQQPEEEEPIQGKTLVQRLVVQRSLVDIYNTAREAVGDPGSEDPNYDWFKTQEAERQPLEQAIREYIGELVGERQVGTEGSTELAQFQINMVGKWQGGHGVLTTPLHDAVLTDLYVSGPDQLKAKIAHEIGHGTGGIEGEGGRLGVMNRIEKLRAMSYIRETMGREEQQYPDEYTEGKWSEEVRADLTGYYLESRAAHKWLDVDERYGHLSSEEPDKEHPPGVVRLAIMRDLPRPLR